MNHTEKNLKHLQMFTSFGLEKNPHILSHVMSEALSFPLGGIHDLHHRTSPCLGPNFFWCKKTWVFFDGGTKPPKFNTFAPEKWWVGRWFVCVWGESDVSWGELLNFGGIVLRICDDTWIWDLVMETNFWCLMIYAHIIESIYCLWRRAFQSNLYTLITNNSIGLLDAVQASVGHRGIHGEKRDCWWKKSG